MCLRVVADFDDGHEKHEGPQNYNLLLLGTSNQSGTVDEDSGTTLIPVKKSPCLEVASTSRPSGFAESHASREPHHMNLSRRWDPATAVPVELHVYNIGTSGRGDMVNRLLRPFGTGAFHCGVEVYSSEWSFSDTTSRKETTGVFKCAPRECKGHTYSQSVSMGRTSCSEAEVLAIVDRLQQDWLANDYDLVRRNCCHFADEFCWRLGVGAIPAWVTHLAGVGASIEDAGDRLHDRAKEVCPSCCSSRSGCGEEHMHEIMDGARMLHIGRT